MGFRLPWLSAILMLWLLLLVIATFAILWGMSEWQRRL
jgi:hypothetical protein